MFNIAPNDTLHVDFCQYEGVDYIVLVDRLTGYIRAEQTPNQGTDSAIQVIKNWSSLFGYPLKIISDGGGGFRDDFIQKLSDLNVKHTHSSSYHSQSNSLAERAVGSLKNSLKKSTKHITKLGLQELIFQINSNISSEMTGSANDRFLLRSVRNSNIPNSINNDLDPGKLINRRIQNHEKRIHNENKTNKIIYEVGDRVRIQDVKTKLFDKYGTITKQRKTDEGSIVSYVIEKDNGRAAIRHRKFLRKLQPEHDPFNITNLQANDVGEDTADDEILDKDRHVNVGKSRKQRNSADHIGKSHKNVDISGECGNLADSKPRRSDRLLKRRNIVKKVSRSTTQQEKTSVKEMGGSCSSDLDETKKENKQLKNRIMLYEAGITDSSIHASQTNIGLLNLSSESNSECTCSSG